MPRTVLDRNRRKPPETGRNSPISRLMLGYLAGSGEAYSSIASRMGVSESTLRKRLREPESIILWEIQRFATIFQIPDEDIKRCLKF